MVVRIVAMCEGLVGAIGTSEAEVAAVRRTVQSAV